MSCESFDDYARGVVLLEICNKTDFEETVVVTVVKHWYWTEEVPVELKELPV